MKLLPEEKKAIETRGTDSVEAYNLYLMARQQLIDRIVRRPSPRRDDRSDLPAGDGDRPQLCAGVGADGVCPVGIRFWHGKDVASRFRPPSGSSDRSATSPRSRCVIGPLPRRGRHGRKRQTAKSRQRSSSIPKSWEVNREAARLMFREGRIRDAMPYFEKAAALMEGDWHNPSMLISCYRGLGDAENLHRAARMTVERADRPPCEGSDQFGYSRGRFSGAGDLRRGSDRAKEWIRSRIAARSRQYDSMRYNLACALATDLHDEDRAIDVLGSVFEHVTSPITSNIWHADPDMDLVPREPTALQDNARRGQATPGHFGSRSTGRPAAAV